MRVPTQRFLVGLLVVVTAAAGIWWSSSLVARVHEMRASGAVSKVHDTVSDAALTAKITAKMSLDDSVRARKIDISTRDTIVTLRGTVQSGTAKARALELARETAGVAGVIDQLAIDEPAGSLTELNASLRGQLAELQTKVAKASAASADLQAQNERLQARLASADATVNAQAATIHAVVEKLFDAKAESGSDAASRDIARIVLNRATDAAGAGDRQVKLAKAVFARGETSLQAGKSAQARSEFRTALDLAELALTRP
jgi:hypothetical protein